MCPRLTDEEFEAPEPEYLFNFIGLLNSTAGIWGGPFDSKADFINNNIPSLLLLNIYFLFSGYVLLNPVQVLEISDYYFWGLCV